MLSFLSPFGKKQISSRSSMTNRTAQASSKKQRSPSMSAHALFDAVSRSEGRD